MTAKIHPLAVVEPGAQLDLDVEIGPFCRIGAEVRLSRGVRVISHASLLGATQVGEESLIYPFASIGQAPQDLKYAGEPSEVIIGKRCQIREHSSIHRGTKGGGLRTVLSDDVLVMTSVHIAHDCQVGEQAILVHGAGIAGHVEIGAQAIIGGMSSLHQYVRVGAHAMVGMSSAVSNDVLPYTTVVGNRASLAGINAVGMKRRGFTREEIQALRNAVHSLFDPSSAFSEALAALQQSAEAQQRPVAELLAFIGADQSKRRYTGP